MHGKLVGESSCFAHKTGYSTGMNKFSISTSGTGFWSTVVKPVTITKIEIDSDPEFNYLVNVYFDTKTWNPEEDGLIYSDEPFIQALRQYLANSPEWKDTRNLNDLHYTEQGMQGNNFISLEFLD